MEEKHYLQLQHSESIIAQMAATIFSAFIQKQTLDSLNEDELVKKSTSIAIKLANEADSRVKSDDEWVRKDNGSPYLV